MSPATGVTRRRGRRLTWLPVVVIVLLVVEIWLLVELGHAIGTGWVLVLLLVETTFGLLVLRRAGRRALEALRATAGVPLGAPVPGRPAGVVGDSLLFGAGGALLVLPGMLSDVFALLCLFPPSRHALRRAGSRLVRRRVERLVRAAGGVVVPGDVIAGDVDANDVVDGEFVEEPRQLGDGRS